MAALQPVENDKRGLAGRYLAAYHKSLTRGTKGTTWPIIDSEGLDRKRYEAAVAKIATNPTLANIAVACGRKGRACPEDFATAVDTAPLPGPDVMEARGRARAARDRSRLRRLSPISLACGALSGDEVKCYNDENCRYVGAGPLEGWCTASSGKVRRGATAGRKVCRDLGLERCGEQERLCRVWGDSCIKQITPRPPGSRATAEELKVALPLYQAGRRRVLAARAARRGGGGATEQKSYDNYYDGNEWGWAPSPRARGQF